MIYSIRQRSILASLGLAFIVLSFLCSSCANTRRLVYMQGAFDTTRLSQVVQLQDTIQKGDLLSIIVYSDNPEATKIYNQALITTGGSNSAGTGGETGGAGGGSAGGGLSGSSPSSGGYLVDEEGNIEFQGLGLLHVQGLTRATLKDTLTGRLKDFLVNPYFTIRFLNYRFTMLGEVTKPGIYGIPGDRISLFQALGLSGDMTFYARRDNILVIREANGKRDFARLDITKPEIMASPYFYLQANDVVIIEPNKMKVAANDQSAIRTITISTAIISTLAILYSIFK
jgi:polysaccharide biosynthesis/export protein